MLCQPFHSIEAFLWNRHHNDQHSAVYLMPQAWGNQEPARLFPEHFVAVTEKKIEMPEIIWNFKWFCKNSAQCLLELKQ